MYNANELSLNAVNTNVCHNCGKVAISYEKAATSEKTSIVYSMLGWLFSIVSLIFVPILFGVLGFALGLITYYGRGKAHGIALMVFASITLILGSLLSFFVTGTIFL